MTDHLRELRFSQRERDRENAVLKEIGKLKSVLIAQDWESEDSWEADSIMVFMFFSIVSRICCPAFMEG